MPTVHLPDGRTVTFPDGTSQEEMVSALSQLPDLAPSHEPQAASDPNAPAPMRDGRPVIHIDKASLPSGRMGPVSDSLPTLGAMAGAAVGGLTSPVTGPVGPAVGAGLGGAGGTALRSLVRGESPDGGEVLTSGLTNATVQAAGPVVGAVGKGIYKGGVALLPKGLKQSYPKMAEAGYREGIALTRRGAEKAERAVAGSANQADGMIASAQAGGAKPINPMEVLRELRPVGQKIQTQEALGLPSDMPALMTRAKSFLGRGPIDLTKAQTLKREAQDLATTAYKARDKGAVINSTEALTNEGQARGLRKGLESRVPGLGDVNARTQELIGLREGAEHASQTGHVLSRLGGAMGMGTLAGPAGVAPALAAAGAGSMLTTPGGLTATGLALKPVAAHLPDAVRVALLLELLGDDGP